MRQKVRRRRRRCYGRRDDSDTSPGALATRPVPARGGPCDARRRGCLVATERGPILGPGLRPERSQNVEKTDSDAIGPTDFGTKGFLPRGPCQSGTLPHQRHCHTLANRGPCRGGRRRDLVKDRCHGALSRQVERGTLKTRTLKRGPCHTVNLPLQGPCYHRNLATETLPHGDLATTGTFSQGPCHVDLVGGPRHEDLATRGPCHKDLTTLTSSRGPRHGDLVTRTLSRGPRHGDLVRGTLPPQGPCHHRDLVTEAVWGPR
ncbi:hypothetical protein M885DRAFT_2266 [Pelagophyceae sp. CCMP2097]|nr:hypothetical protein M885DRAFT_2266 [Pelagophyceae sp. CCMP2097]